MPPATTPNGHLEGKVAVIPLNKIRENQVALREVDKESEDYLGLVDSIRQKGVLNPIVVREIKNPDNPEEMLYGLIDGLHRFKAAQDAGLEHVPANIRNMDQAEIEEAQIVANVHKIETKPVEYTKQLERLMTRNPTMTVSELARRLAKSTEWLYKRFGLLKLDQKIADLVDQGKIKLNNAYQLAKLPKEEQEHFLERAMTMTPEEFSPTVTARVKEIREARRQGRQATPPEFKPVAHQRKWSEVKSEFENPQIGPRLVADTGVKDPVAGFALGVAWCSNMDPHSQEAQRQQHESDTRRKEEDKVKRQKERAEKRAADAQTELQKIQNAAEPVGAT